MKKYLLARITKAIRGIDRDYPEWGLRSLIEECELAAKKDAAITRPHREAP